MTGDRDGHVEQAFVLAEIALSAAAQALETAQAAEAAAVEASRLAGVSRDAAQRAFDLAERAKAGGRDGR